jgi:hypothetical protein
MNGITLRGSISVLSCLKEDGAANPRRSLFVETAIISKVPLSAENLAYRLEATGGGPA